MAAVIGPVKSISLLLSLLMASVTLATAQNIVIEPNTNPLRPADTSSPQATIRSFIENVEEGYLRATELLMSYAASERLYLNTTERRMLAENLQNLLKAVRCLDLSGISPVLRNVVPIERALQLKEILDRIELPPFQDIPDREDMVRSSSKRWTIPNTEIDIVLVEDGPRAGEYLVSAETVDRLPDYYERIRNLPYKDGPAKELNATYRALSSGRTESIYGAYLGSPAVLGRFIPIRWMLKLPSWATARVAGVTVWQWLGISLGLMISVLFVVLANRAGRRLAGRKDGESDPGWHRLPTPLAVIIVASHLMPAVSELLHIGGNAMVAIASALTIMLALGAAWISVIGGTILGETIVLSQHRKRRGLDNQLIRLITRFSGFVVAIGFIMGGADRLGFPAYSVLAGLGVGGLAVALAARDSLANLLGSVVIMIEKPFRVGHWIKVGEAEGTVEDVGFRSTRIRTFYNSLISIPNNEVVNAVVDNLGRRSMRRQMFFLQITYDTPRDKIEKFKEAIKQRILEHPLTDKDNLHVRFNKFSESGLDILVYFFLRVPDYVIELEEREQILLQIMDLAKEIGVDFAFPTRTLHLDRTSGTAGDFSNEKASGSEKPAK